LYRKTVKTFEGIEVLKRRRLVEESWVLLRVLLEAHVNFVYYLSHEPTDMVHRYLDASVLDKLKHLREVGFYRGTSLEADIRQEDWDALEKKIKARYTDGEFVALRKNGFTGLSFQQRAKAVGLEEMYQYCYRIASRSVHSFDPAETPVFARALRGRVEVKYDLLRARREQLDANQNMLLGRAAYFMSKFIREPLITMELVLIGVGYEKFRDRAKTLAHRTAHDGEVEASSEGDGFHVWRI
jgi:hypothetical protein